MRAHEKHTVMFVDDEEGVRLSWNRYLTSKGFAVTTAENAATAIERMSEVPAEVVVSDLRMPGLDGLQMIERLRTKNTKTRFILLTGYGDSDVERRAKELGVDAYLNKPISPETLSAVITTALVSAKEARTEPSPATLSNEAEAELVAVPLPATTTTPAPAEKSWRIVLGLVSAPILGLAFAMFLPFIGIALLGKVAFELVTRTKGV